MTMLPVLARVSVEEWKRQDQLTQLNWPAQSPELSPIENVWLLMKNKKKIDFI